MRVAVIGPLEVTSRGRAVEVRSAKQRAVLSMLALRSGEVVTLDSLIDVLWGRDPPPSAVNSLQSHVARLRKAIGHDVLRTHPAGYVLLADVDLTDFARLLDDAAAAPDAEHEAALLDDAISLWRGEPLMALPADVAAPHVTALQARHAAARRRRAEIALQQGDVATAVRQAGALVADRPFDEPAAITLATAQAAAGQVPDALAVLDRLRDTMVEHLGLDPTPRVDELRRRLLALDADLVRGGEAPTPARAAEPAVTGRDRHGAPAPGRRGRLRAAAGAAVAGSSPSSLPAARRLIGRDADLARLATALEHHRLVTVVGPAGVGKTSLARQAAGRWGVSRSDAPVWWVDLAPVPRGSGGEQVAERVAEALELTTDDRSADAVRAALRHRLGLVVLDSCEHVIDEVVDLVAEVGIDVGGSTVLSTSREAFGLTGEHRLVLSPLAPGDDLALLGERAADVGVDLRPGDLDGARRVCAALDGLPLAIELAAARLPAMGVDDLAERLASSLWVLDERRRGRDRHRSVRDVVQWSLDLLAPPERLLFRRLSVFAGTFSMEAARVVASDERLSADQVADGLVALVEQSLVVHGPAGYRMLRPVHAVAAQRLAEHGETEPVLDRLATFLLHMASAWPGVEASPAEVTHAVRLDLALDDLRAEADRRGGSSDADWVIEVVAALRSWAYYRSRVDVLSWGEAAVERDHPRAAGALAAAVAAAWQRGRLERAVALLTPALRRLEQAACDARDAAGVHEVAGDVAVMNGDLEAACRHYRRQGRVGDHRPATEISVRANLALAMAWAGDTAGGARLADEAVTLAEASGAQILSGLSHYVRGEILADVRPDDALGDLAVARQRATDAGARLLVGVAATAELALRGRHGPPLVALSGYREAIDRWYAIGADGLLTTALRNLVVLLARMAADDEAVALHAALESGFADKPAYGDEAARLQTAMDSARMRLGPDAVGRATLRGQAAGSRREAVVDLARRALDSARAGAS